MAKTVLVIEDEEAIRSVIRAFLEDAGYTVVQAADGEAGVAQFRACRPDLVLLDVMLPKLDGFAVCKILRQESRTPICGVQDFAAGEPHPHPDADSAGRRRQPAQRL